MTVNYYYSDDLTADTEGNLVQLCRACATKHQGVVQWASKGDNESECELCGATNDAARTRELDELMAAQRG